MGKVHSAGSPKAARQAVDALEPNKYCRKGDNCIDISASEHYDSDSCDAGETCVTSFLTMESVSGVTFGITNIVGNFGTVFVDQSYWQSAVAAKPKSAQPVFHDDTRAWKRGNPRSRIARFGRTRFLQRIAQRQWCIGGHH